MKRALGILTFTLLLSAAAFAKNGDQGIRDQKQQTSDTQPKVKVGSGGFLSLFNLFGTAVDTDTVRVKTLPVYPRRESLHKPN